jgi:multidrug efflux pump subunit AcrB
MGQKSFAVVFFLALATLGALLAQALVAQRRRPPRAFGAAAVVGAVLLTGAVAWRFAILT